MAARRSIPTAVVRVQGDLVVATTPALYRRLRILSRRRYVRAVVVDFAEAGRLDSSGAAVVSLASRMMADHKKSFALENLSDMHRAALELLPASPPATARAVGPSLPEQVGERLLGMVDRAAELVTLLRETVTETFAVVMRRRRLPAGAFTEQAAKMGVDALPIVGLLVGLLGMTLAFQGAVQLQQFGADVFVADLVGLAVIREFAPMMTAIILTGRTGAAIAAELGTMRVRSEVDALRAMGVSPVRYLVVPRIAALTVVQPLLTVFAMALGVAGGMFIAATTMDLSPVTFWERMVQRVGIADFVHGVGKSVVFAQIVGFTGCFMGLNTEGSASDVGTSTTRAVVVGIFLVILVDAGFATISTLSKAS
jgi:phospholipid/cholesterol/gamma-HCH transport system permease protein